MVYHWTLGLVMREQNTKLNSNRYVGLAESGLGGRGRNRPPRQKFSVTSVGVIFNQWGLTPQPLTNRTLSAAYYSNQLFVERWIVDSSS